MSPFPSQGEDEVHVVINVSMDEHSTQDVKRSGTGVFNSLGRLRPLARKNTTSKPKTSLRTMNILKYKGNFDAE